MRKNNANRPTFGPSSTQGANKKYVERGKKNEDLPRKNEDLPKKKYVAKNNDQIL